MTFQIWHGEKQFPTLQLAGSGDIEAGNYLAAMNILISNSIWCVISFLCILCTCNLIWHYNVKVMSIFWLVLLYILIKFSIGKLYQNLSYEFNFCSWQCGISHTLHEAQIKLLQFSENYENVDLIKIYTFCLKNFLVWCLFNNLQAK